ncbi:RapZ C-terminal domain-containing protein [Kitasatospora cineracea]|uniref:P-loop ATPase family protein n=1 Tax=Kitasatospora cineracea TaxID=88074 RepID=A0A3N4R6J5_9ACTN|nr:P-loop ATPase family protein [Kitasatospora cineracea]
MNVTIISFGYLHGTPPPAHLVFDLRDHFRDPHKRPAFRDLTGDDPEVQAAVLGTDGIPDLIDAATMAVRAYAGGPRAAEFGLTVAFGCAGGRHRAHVAAADTARLLIAEGYDVTLIHRDVHRAVVERDERGRHAEPTTLPSLPGMHFHSGVQVGAVFGDIGEMTISKGARGGSFQVPRLIASRQYPHNGGVARIEQDSANRLYLTCTGAGCTAETPIAGMAPALAALVEHTGADAEPLAD